jgi:hypothetical protein
LRENIALLRFGNKIALSTTANHCLLSRIDDSAGGISLLNKSAVRITDSVNLALLILLSSVCYA